MGKRHQYSQWSSQLRQCSSPSCSCWWNTADSQFCCQCAAPLSSQTQTGDGSADRKGKGKGKGKTGPGAADGGAAKAGKGRSWLDLPRKLAEESNVVLSEEEDAETGETSSSQEMNGRGPQQGSDASPDLPDASAVQSTEAGGQLPIKHYQRAQHQAAIEKYRVY